MPGGQIHFFATPLDIRPVLEEFESTVKVQYVPCDTRRDLVVTSLSRLSQESSLGRARSGDNNGCATYVVATSNASVVSEQVDRYDGNTVYTVDLRLNPHAISLRPSGVYEPDCIIDGNAGFLSDDPRARELFSALKKAIRKRFTFLHTHYVGTEALSLLDKGWRLTQGVRVPKKWDLTRAGRGVE